MATTLNDTLISHAVAASNACETHPEDFHEFRTSSARTETDNYEDAPGSAWLRVASLFVMDLQNVNISKDMCNKSNSVSMRHEKTLAHKTSQESSVASFHDGKIIFVICDLSFDLILFRYVNKFAIHETHGSESVAHVHANIAILINS